MLMFVLSFYLFSVSTVDLALEHWKRTQMSVNDMGNKHVSAMVSLIRWGYPFHILFIRILLPLPKFCVGNPL